MGGSLEPSLGRRAMALLPWMTLGIASMAWCYGVTVMAREGAVHQVGGTPGWSLPSRSMVNYTQWAATQMFVVGDTLYFNYSNAYHNVVQVTATKYANCDASAPIETWADGATRIKLSTAGTFYYICGVPGHCSLGQLVAIPVLEAGAAPTPTPALAPTSGSTPTQSMAPAPASPASPGPSSSPSPPGPPPSSSTSGGSTASLSGNSSTPSNSSSSSSATSVSTSSSTVLPLLLLLLLLLLPPLVLSLPF